MTRKPQSKRSSAAGRRTADDIIALQRRLFERHRRLIEASESTPSPGMRRYYNEYRKAVRGTPVESGFGALCDAIARSQIAYVADYHTLALSQRTFLKLVRAVMQQVDNLCLALEFVDASHQENIEKYQSGRISERTFLRRIEYKKNWPYDIWPHFRPIFELAKAQGFPLLGIDAPATLPLTSRDRRAAEVLAEASCRYPGSTLLVLVGRLHVAPSHLPAAVERAFQRKGLDPPRRVIVHQNSEVIYWQLAAQRRESTEVVQLSDESYCVLNTPPLVEQMSYLHWVRYDEDLLEHTTLDSTVRLFVHTLAEFLVLPLRDSECELRVLGPGDMMLAELLGSISDRRRKKRLLLQVEADESVFVPEVRTIYLGTLSVNHAAEEAAHFVKHAVGGGAEPLELRDRFYFHALNEACGFFGSKVINPKRKTDHSGKLRRIAASRGENSGKPTAEQRAAAFALEHLSWERGRGRKHPAGQLLADPAVFVAAAHMLGYILGDKMYYGLVSGQVQKSLVRELFLCPLDAPYQALEYYLEFSAMLMDVTIPQRI
ncbi:MAG: ChaN family lipoprotein [Myxococcota bacterium]|nr:ChaN family lipoprotein [Myxococcota bacterium]